MSWLGQFDDFDQFDLTNNNQPFNNTKKFTVQSTGLRNDNGERCSIENLVAGTPNVTIVGLVIAKEDSREITGKSSNSHSTTRYALSFVFRDSVSSFISATCWGSEGFIKDLSKSFHINDVVEIYNSQIQSKPDGAERFRPWTPSPFHLNISESHSTLKPYSDWDSSNYTSLQHVPIRQANDFYPLCDVIENGQAISGEHVNLLAAVKSVGPAKEIITKKGRHVKRCEVKLFDETCSTFSLILWDEEIVNQAVLWNPGEYVLFGCDLRVYYDDFRNSMVATADSKTIFIVNPDTKEAHALYLFAQSQNLNANVQETPDNFGETDPPISDITEVVSVKGAKAMEQTVTLGSPYFCIVYAFITQFDIDQDSKLPVRYKCPKCKQSLEDNQQVCLNPACLDNSTSGEFSAIPQYDIPVTLSDHTGSISNCRLNPSAAEEIIGSQPQDFIQIDCYQRTNLKWKTLLERCKVYLKIQRSRNNGNTFCRVLSLTHPDPLAIQRCLSN